MTSHEFEFLFTGTVLQEDGNEELNDLKFTVDSISHKYCSCMESLRRKAGVDFTVMDIKALSAAYARTICDLALREGVKAYELHQIFQEEVVKMLNDPKSFGLLNPAKEDKMKFIGKPKAEA